MAEHSPLPWFVPVHLDGPTITNSEGLIADVDLSLTAETDSANAAYIVKACNAYPELVKALEEILAQCELAIPIVGGPASDAGIKFGMIRMHARDALAKAKAGL